MSTVGRYHKRLSGLLLDRSAKSPGEIDSHVEVPRVDYEKLNEREASWAQRMDTRRGESSKVIRTRVESARERLRRRSVAVDDSAKHLLTNADMGPGEICEFCPVDDAGHSLLRATMRQLNMSARAYHRTLKLARTVADLAGAERIEAALLGVAVQYRPQGQV